MDLKEFMNQAMEMANERNEVKDGDYKGENGLWYCGKCHTPKQARFVLFGTVETPMCLCKCEKEKKDEADRKFYESEAKAKMALRIKQNKLNGFPEAEMMNWSFKNDMGYNPKITEAMMRYVDKFDEMKSRGKGLLLYGTQGTGKTYSACMVANELIERGRTALVSSFSRITNTITGLYEKQQYLDDLNTYDLIVIDDLGVERKSDYMQEMIFNIIDSRYRAGLPMIITTNLTIKEIKEPSNIANARIYDRIIERCFPIEFSGMNIRRKVVRDDYQDMKDLLGL